MLLPILLLIYNYLVIAFIILLFYYLLNFWVLILVFLNERTDIQTKITWTFMEFSMPGLGAYIYYIFARNPKKILKNLKKSELLENEILLKNIENLDMKLLINGEEKFPEVFNELEKAEKFINIQYFVFNHGILQSKLFSILRKKKKENVKIRILFDYLGSFNLDELLIETLRKEGFEIINFRPINWIRPSGADNWRSHNKLISIDGNVAFFGGINFGDEYAGLTGKYGEWIDSHYIYRGEIVSSFDAIFAVQWHIATGKDISKELLLKKNAPTINMQTKEFEAEILYDSPERPVPLTFKKIKEEIRNSKNKIKIISPYIAFPVSFKDEIRNAINRGVSVEFITIGLADKKSAYYQGSFDIETLTELGAKVYRVENIFIHTKMFIFDEKKSIIGTTNLDYRALFHHFEVNILIKSNYVKILNKYFEDIKQKSILTMNSRADWWIGRSIVYFILRLFKGLF